MGMPISHEVVFIPANEDKVVRKSVSSQWPTHVHNLWLALFHYRKRPKTQSYTNPQPLPILHILFSWRTVLSLTGFKWTRTTNFTIFRRQRAVSGAVTYISAALPNATEEACLTQSISCSMPSYVIRCSLCVHPALSPLRSLALRPTKPACAVSVLYIPTIEHSGDSRHCESKRLTYKNVCKM